MKLLSHVRLLVTPWTAAYQAPPYMGFSRQEYWSGVPLPSLGAMLSKSLIQFSVDGWGCVPSLLFDLRPNYCRGNEDNGDLLQKDSCLYSCIHCSRPCSRPLLIHTSARDSWTLTPSLAQSLVEKLLLFPGPWYIQGLFFFFFFNINLFIWGGEVGFPILFLRHLRTDPPPHKVLSVPSKGLFPVLWKFCNQIPLASKVKFPGGSQSLCQIPKLGNLL